MRMVMISMGGWPRPRCLSVATVPVCGHGACLWPGWPTVPVCGQGGLRGLSVATVSYGACLWLRWPTVPVCGQGACLWPGWPTVPVCGQGRLRCLSVARVAMISMGGSPIATPEWGTRKDGPALLRGAFTDIKRKADRNGHSCDQTTVLPDSIAMDRLSTKNK